MYENGGFQNYGFRMYDTRIARFWGVDPLTKNYPMLTPFQFASNTPIWATDLDGQEALYHQLIDKIKRKAIAIAIKKSQEILTTMIKSIVNQFDNKVKKRIHTRSKFTSVNIGETLAEICTSEKLCIFA